jgi:hypothetical protein
MGYVFVIQDFQVQIVVYQTYAKIIVIIMDSALMENANAILAGKEKTVHSKYVLTIAVIMVSVRIGDVSASRDMRDQTAVLRNVIKNA